LRLIAEAVANGGGRGGPMSRDVVLVQHV
jgi:hypothetical protein